MRPEPRSGTLHSRSMTDRERAASGAPRAIKVVNEWRKVVCRQLERRQSDRQFETLRPGAPGIQIKHATDDRDPRSVRVAGNDHVNSAQGRIEAYFPAGRAGYRWTASEPCGLGVRIGLRPIAFIDVPPNRSHRRNLADPGDHVWARESREVGNKI